MSRSQYHRSLLQALSNALSLEKPSIFNIYCLPSSIVGIDRDVDSPGCTGPMVCMQHLLHTGNYTSYITGFSYLIYALFCHLLTFKSPHQEPLAHKSSMLDTCTIKIRWRCRVFGAEQSMSILGSSLNSVKNRRPLHRRYGKGQQRLMTCNETGFFRQMLSERQRSV